MECTSKEALIIISSQGRIRAPHFVQTRQTIACDCKSTLDLPAINHLLITSICRIPSSHQSIPITFIGAP